MKRLLVFAAIAGATWFYLSRPVALQVEAAPPQVALQSIPSESEAPVQRNLGKAAVFQINGYELRAMAAFASRARVLSVEHYRTGREAELSPTDLALGWGRMADPQVIARLSISQGGRWYHWRYEGALPLPSREIETSSANMHLIPANAEVARALRAVDKGKIVSLKGYLVEARGKDGWTWRSSLSRDDTGSGSCELVFVQAIELH